MTTCLSQSPFLVIFRDFFPQKELTAFIEHAKPNLERSTHLIEGDYNKTSRQRTSKQTWADEDLGNLDLGRFREAEIVSSRIELATLQNATSVFLGGGGESFQVGQV